MGPNPINIGPKGVFLGTQLQTQLISCWHPSNQIQWQRVDNVFTYTPMGLNGCFFGGAKFTIFSSQKQATQPLEFLFQTIRLG